MKLLLTAFLSLLFCIFAAGPLAGWNENYAALQSHFERVTKERFNALFDGIKTVKDWESERSAVRAKLLQMLGHGRDWPREPPACRITHRVERRDYVLECLVLQTDPGVYVTANFYIPRDGRAPYPLIIYQSGHSGRGLYGNKTAFKHHGAWLAAHGISVLIMDTIELGELQVTHHGVYWNKRYDLYSRGYSPLGVEVYNARRVIDYLVTRPEVDTEKIGATGISGGGVCTFFLTLTDNRIKAAAPVSGECSSVGQIEGRLAVEHCDCMYPVNSFGLLFSEMGALAAPRPFLPCNAESDPLYPLPYFEQMVEKIREVYNLYGKGQNLNTAVVPGGHADSEIIRLPVYAFFLKEFLGLDTTLTEHGPVDTLAAEELLCIRDGYPLDERLTRIQEEFMPRAQFVPQPVGSASAAGRLHELTETLRSEVFTFFPKKDSPFEPRWEESRRIMKREHKRVSFNSFPDLRVQGTYSLPEKAMGKGRLPAVLFLEDRTGIEYDWGGGTKPQNYDWGERAVLVAETLDLGARAIDDSLRHQMRREATIIGRSFDGMRVYEILRSLDFLRSLPEVDPQRIAIVGKGPLGVNGLYAALLDGKVKRVVLGSPPASHTQGPYYLGILTHTDIPEVISLIADKVKLYGEVPPEIESALKTAAPENVFKFSNLAECLE
ncbi:MAG TPA: hypothetical protein VM123_02490 [archaeon]|nr:hypothetical protein [archaeon]